MIAAPEHRAVAGMADFPHLSALFDEEFIGDQIEQNGISHAHPVVRWAAEPWAEVRKATLTGLEEALCALEKSKAAGLWETLARLRQGGHNFYSARAEVMFAAWYEGQGILRAMQPRVTPSLSHGKRNDILLQAADGSDLLGEVYTPNIIIDVLELHGRLHTAYVEAIIKDRCQRDLDVGVRPSDDFRLPDRKPDYERCLRNAVCRFLQWLNGAHNVPRVKALFTVEGGCEVIVGPPGELGGALGPPKQLRWDRIMRGVRNKAKRGQISSTRPCVALIELTGVPAEFSMALSPYMPDYFESLTACVRSSILRTVGVAVVAEFGLDKAQPWGLRCFPSDSPLCRHLSRSGSGRDESET